MPADSQEISSTTQKFLDIFDITSNVTVLRDGTVSMTLLVSAMNFGLLAEQEQDSIIYAYASLLNSLNFPIQIVINSKTKDATSYLQLLEDQIKKTRSENKKQLIKRYQGFVGRLIKERNVLDKKFYVVIPALPIEVGMLTAQSILPGNTSPEISDEKKATIIEKAIGILEPRRDHMISQFNRIGLYARQLTTQEIIEVFYNSYNPEAYEGQQITDSQSYSTTMVKAGKTQAPTISEIKEQLKTKDELEKISSAKETKVKPSPEPEKEKPAPIKKEEILAPIVESKTPVISTEQAAKPLQVAESPQAIEPLQPQAKVEPIVPAINPVIVNNQPTVPVEKKPTITMPPVAEL